RAPPLALLERGFWSGETPEKAFWGMQFDVSVFRKVALTFDCQNGSQKRLWRGKYFRENGGCVGGVMPISQQHAPSKLGG
ncbi:MAG: hypothetical protein NT049_15975, partial [Planctomycetota bacterium]|nr:hypothetical protein [Planctomycetota bacterium]